MKQRKLTFALSDFERDVVLVDGSTVHLRPVHPSDADGVRQFFEQLSPRSRFLRFHHPRPRVSDDDIRRFTEVDYDKSFGIVATLGEAPEERIIGIGNYVSVDDDRADAALAVEDSHQGLGIGTQIVETLAQAARRNGITAFEADVLAENNRMIEVFRDIGFPVQSGFKYGTLHVEFPTAETEEEVGLSEEREAIAAAASLRVFFEPRTVAVIGASREAGTVGHELFQNVLRGGFKGTVYPVNKKARSIAGVRAYASVLDIPDEIDLAIVAVPAEAVIEVAEDCAHKGARGVVVISAGFRETDSAGAEREQLLLHKMRAYGIRMVGPNCMGVLNADPAVSFNGTFSPVFTPSGKVGLLSQSGALGLALLDYARDLNIGLSTFISVGNKADVSGNDLIQYWERDPSTDVILLYLESFGNPRKFGRLARRVSAQKPIVAVKSGRTSAGSRAALSHTGALASVDVAVDALFRQSGVIRTDTLEELFDVAALLAHQPLPEGRRVAILTNAGGPGILAADACEANGLNVVELSAETQELLRQRLPPAAGVRNPVDMIASATPEQYAECFAVLLADQAVDAVIVIYIPPLAVQSDEVAAGIREVARSFEGQKTILACFMSARGAPRELTYGKSALPSYAFPESAARALARAADYAAWRKRPQGAVPMFRVDREAAQQVIWQTLERSGAAEAWLNPEEWQSVLGAYGIRCAPLSFASSARSAADAARELGFPVAVKLASPTITHKSDIGGVILGVSSGQAVQRAYRQIHERVRKLDRLNEVEGAIVQKMISGGVEVLVGVTQDPSFGPLVMFGLGGTMVELMKDVQIRLQPLTDIDAREMVRSIKGYPLLEGWRGSAAGDVAAAEELILRVSQIVEELPEIVEMDLNPVKLLRPGEGAVVVDCRIFVKANRAT
jgi:acetyl coenzyme A synthetase (ADP forming)-like protein